ncbi:MAG TPA: tryptophan--tRNA ligase [Gammaproteobacteria bacterium]|nr:tryptophan--tRNA ligase [Gammaproteobacteria bacterium]
MSVPGQQMRVVSGMRPTGRLHLGHYHGVLKNWVKLQQEYECFFFVADWHALTTHYDDPKSLNEHVWDMVIDWLACGVDPGRATLFIQSQVPQHAELNLLLSMITPLSWLERVPSYKDQQEKLKERELATHGFLGYPVLQAADILMYQASMVPVGEDQVPHIELTREIARRFNYLYGREEGYEEKAERAIQKMGKKAARLYRQLRTAYTEQGDSEAIERAHALLDAQHNITLGDRERLYGYLEGGGRIILQEPDARLTQSPKLPGLDGQKMSKSYGNAIALRDDPDRVTKALRAMPTDPARVRRNDPGNPEKCPVWQLHEVYSLPNTKAWVIEGCTTAGIGCLDCKQSLIEVIIAEQHENHRRAKEYSADPTLVRNIIADGCERAREVAEDTMEEVRHCVGTDYY